MAIRVKKEKPLPSTTTCNAKRKDGQPCRKPAGHSTVHPGSGRCIQHDRGAEQHVKHGWYTKVKHARVREILQDLQDVEMNVMDLIPEATLLRAMTIDYVNRYEDFQAAIMAWYADPESTTRPRKILDISDAANLIEAISRIVARMHQIQSEGAISLETFKRVTEHMGVIVAKYTKDPETLNKIEAEWMDLALDAKPPTR
jgi:hypothetical protein